MTATGAYSRAHSAFNAIALRNGLTATDIRVLVALRERGGNASTDLLEQDLALHGSGVRRSGAALVAEDCVIARSVTGGRVKRGVRSLLQLTEEGTQVADDALALACRSAS